MPGDGGKLRGVNRSRIFVVQRSSSWYRSDDLMKGIIAVFLLSLAVTWGDNLKDLSGAGRDPEVDEISFRRTATWGKEFSEWTRKPTRFLPKNWKSRIQLPPPPANSSPRTAAELDALDQRLAERPGKQAGIVKEVLITNFRFGDHRYEELITQPAFKETGELLRAAYLELAVVTFVFKQRYDRVRPSVLAEKLERPLDSSIDIPAHPAYPSGHATGAYGLAYLLQELDPANAVRYLADARQIGENREVAGVHYPSDTEAGRLLARQIVDALLENPAFARQVEKARSEW